MRDGGRVAAAIAVLEDFSARRVPLKVCLADWARGARFAGSKDRASISGLCLDVLRRQGTLAEAGDGSVRMSVGVALAAVWGWPHSRVAEAYADEPHGPGALSEEETALLAEAQSRLEAADPLMDVPDFTRVLFAEIGVTSPEAIGALCERAPVDLRVNTLKSDAERAVKALSALSAELIEGLATGIRLPAPSADKKAPDVTSHPAFQKGWVEVQDAGSQIAALSACEIVGAQVLDYCAGGGGKTLALAAMMENTGQLFAYDVDAKRLAPLFERARRAGVRNVQIVSPAEGTDKLDALAGKMDVVFVDAPCSGSGTWRRHPDTKWRLTEEQLERRMAEQDAVLAEAARFVAPGGRLVFVTCSVFKAENEDRVEAFLAAHPAFGRAGNGGAVTQRLLPGSDGTDGFGITRLFRAA